MALNVIRNGVMLAYADIGINAVGGYKCGGRISWLASVNVSV
jgi:hypothetical protein